jgi:hypothetical protein
VVAAVWRRACGIGGAIGISACTLLTGSSDLETRNTEPENRANHPTGTGDGSGNPGTPSTSGGPLTSDGGSPGPLDGSGPPPNPDGGSSGVWCALQSPAPMRCFDFEKDDISGFVPELDRGSFAIEQGVLRASMPDATSGYGYFVVPLAGPIPTTIRWSFDVRLDGVQPTVNVEVMELFLAYGGTAGCALQPTTINGSVAVNEFCQTVGPNFQQNHEIVPLQKGTAGWYRVAVSVTLETKAMQARVTRPDGMTNAINITLDDRFQRGTAELRTGLTWSAGSAPGHVVRIDNVALDWQ